MSIDLDAPEHRVCSEVIAERDARIRELNRGLATATKRCFEYRALVVRCLRDAPIPPALRVEAMNAISAGSGDEWIDDTLPLPPESDPHE
jgi:hypothetical protein